MSAEDYVREVRKIRETIESIQDRIREDPELDIAEYRRISSLMSYINGDIMSFLSDYRRRHSAIDNQKTDGHEVHDAD